MSTDRTRTTPGDLDLEAFLDAARADAPAPSEALLARIEAQGMALQPRPRPVATAHPVENSAQGWGTRLSEVLAGIGGWPSLGGLTAALVVGFGLGLSPPDTIETLAAEMLDGGTSATLSDVFWTFDASQVEG